jgi:4-amino-4-deoxy-L-arabinose transferase-like glycosyltransferase
MTVQDRRGLTRAIVVLLLLLLALRLAAMAGLPLMDTTEARYGEIGRKMAELNDWVTPWTDSGQPFWAKPPLSFWMTAASFKLFGVSEFSARLPHLLCGLAILGLGFDLARRIVSPRAALFSVALLASSALFFVSSGAVMTDAALVLCTTWAMHAFWLALHRGSRAHAWGFFIALGLGLLAKGPLTLVLAGLPLLIWAVWERRVGEAWRALPWLRGLLLMLAIGAPWYLLAEQRTPGFLDYFIVGEHWHRFVTPGWKGDLYGKAHEEAIGMIWPFALAALLPWTLLLPLASRFTRADAAAPAPERGWKLYLLLWALLPLLFFTFARNIIWPYVLPSMPALAVLGGAWLARRDAQAEAWVAGGLAASLALLMGVAVVAEHQNRIEQSSARQLVRCYEAVKAGQGLWYLGQRPFSASFYSDNQVAEAPDFAALRARLPAGGGFVALPEKQLGELGAAGLLVNGDYGRFGKLALVRISPAL